MNYPDTAIIPKTMCQDDVENYFSLQRARVSSGQPTVGQYFESAATLSTNLLLSSEFGELKDCIGSYDPVCMPNAVKIPLLRRNKKKGPSDFESQICPESSASNNEFIPLTVTPNTYEQAQKLQLLRHAKQTLEYIDLSTSSTLIQVNQIIVQAMKSDVNSQHLLSFISCLDNGLRKYFFNKDSWCENSLKKALVATRKDMNLKHLWKDLLAKMHITHIDNELACDLLFLFVKKFTKRRCVTYLAIDGLGPSAEKDNSAIRQLLKKYDMLARKKHETVRDSPDQSKSKCHGCGELGHWVRNCPKGYNKDWLTRQQCFKCKQFGHFRKDCPFKTNSSQSKLPTIPCTKQTNESGSRLQYNPTTALPKMIGFLDKYDLDKSTFYEPLTIIDNSEPQKTKQNSEEWFNFRKGKINGSKAAVCLGWLGKPLMKSYWDNLRQSKETTHSEISNKNELAMTWGSMCEKSALATYISKFLSQKYPKGKVSETGVHIIKDSNGIPWLASSPDGLVNIETISNAQGVVEFKCPFMGGKPFPYRSVCVNHIPQVMLEMYCINTTWCHYVVWTPVGYHIYIVKRDDNYIADLLSYLKTFWDSATNQNSTMPPWQADAFNLKRRAEEISKYCQKLSSGESVRDNDILEHPFLDLFWKHEKEKMKSAANELKPVTIRKCGACKEDEWKCKLNPCEIRLERVKNNNKLLDKQQIAYQSYTWGSGGLGNSCYQDTILEFLYHPFRRQIQLNSSNSGKGMCVLDECFRLREEGKYIDSKLRLWKWLRDETDNGHIYYPFGRSASIIGIFFRLIENSAELFTLNFRITEKIATVCTLQPQKHTRRRTKHHVIFPLTDDDLLREHVSADHKYKINVVVEHLLTRTDQLLTSSWCGNVIFENNPEKPSPTISEITHEKAHFCNGKNIITSQVQGNPKFFFVMRTVTSAYIPNLNGHINLANSTYKLTGIVYFNGMHYWCEVLSTQLGYKKGWFFYDGMVKGGKAEYVGETPQCKQSQCVHILLYEQCSTNTNIYGMTHLYEQDKLTSIISSYRLVLNLSDTKIKIQNLKAVLKHKGISFPMSAKLEDLKAMLLHAPESSHCTPRNTPNTPHTSTSSEVDMTTPPSTKDMPSFKRMCGTPTKFSDYTPERHAPKKLKKSFLSSVKKSSLNKKVTTLVKWLPGSRRDPAKNPASYRDLAGK